MNLEKLYKLQEELDNHIWTKHKTLDKLSNKELLDNTVLALLVEVGELANTTRCFKHWSTKRAESKERLLDELADVWHFYLSIGNQAELEMTEECYPTKHHIEWVKEKAKLEQVFIMLYSHVADLYVFGVGHNTYKDAGKELIVLSGFMGFTNEEVEQAYLKKHEENYRRQGEGY